MIVAAATAISLGTYIGGWRIIRTLGHRVTQIDTPQGFSAETTSAVVILAASHAGLSALDALYFVTKQIFLPLGAPSG